MIRPLLYLGAGGLAIGVYFHYKRQANILYNTEYSIDNVKVRDIKLNNAQVTFDFVIKNHSNYAFIVNAYNLYISINNNPVARLQASGINFVIAKGGVPSALKLVANFKPLELGDNLLDIATDILNKNSISIGIKGTLNGKLGLLSFVNLPIDYSYKP